MFLLIWLLYVISTPNYLHDRLSIVLRPPSIRYIQVVSEPTHL